MSVYKIQKKIKRFEIFKPGTTLKNWYSRQTDKPDILFNASLYTNTSKPCGTIWDNGVLVSNQGKGFGFGTTDGKTIGFGQPWDKQWRDYLTGYYGLVQDGKVIDPPWKDSYVFDQALNRIAFGLTKDNCPAVICENGKTITQFAKNAVTQGFQQLCNLDGGGSRALLWMGKWIYTSSRTPYNAIAIWLEDEPKVEVELKENEMRVICKKKTSTYNAKGSIEIGRSIAAQDECIIQKDIKNGLLIEISYPTSSGMRTAFIKNLENFSEIV